MQTNNTEDYANSEPQPGRKRLLAKIKTSSGAAIKPEADAANSPTNIAKTLMSAPGEQSLPMDQSINSASAINNPNAETTDTKDEIRHQDNKSEDDIRAYYEAIDMFELIVEKLWARGKARKNATPTSESQLLLSSVEKDLMTKMATRLNQLAADLDGP
jgi:hypothetical protein